MLLYRYQDGWAARRYGDDETVGVDSGTASFGATSTSARYFNDAPFVQTGDVQKYRSLADGPASTVTLSDPHPFGTPGFQPTPSFEWTMSQDVAPRFVSGRARSYTSPMVYTKAEFENGVLVAKIDPVLGVGWQIAHNQFASGACIAPSSPPTSCNYQTTDGARVIDRRGRVTPASIGVTVSNVETVELDYSALFRWSYGQSGQNGSRHYVGFTAMPGATPTPDAYLRQGVGAIYAGQASMVAVVGDGPALAYDTDFSATLLIAPSRAPEFYNTTTSSSVTVGIGGGASGAQVFQPISFRRSVAAGDSLVAINSSARTIDVSTPTTFLYGGAVVRNGSASMQLFGPTASELGGNIFLDVNPNLGIVGAFVGRQIGTVQ